MNDNPTTAAILAALMEAEREQVALHILAAEMSGKIMNEMARDAREALLNGPTSHSTGMARIAIVRNTA